MNWLWIGLAALVAVIGAGIWVAKSDHQDVNGEG
jgi:hypothetical protein